MKIQELALSIFKMEWIDAGRPHIFQSKIFEREKIKVVWEDIQTKDFIHFKLKMKLLRSKLNSRLIILKVLTHTKTKKILVNMIFL